MAATFTLERVKHHIIPAVAALIGLGVAFGIATVPSDVLNAAVDRGGFSGILPAAASPIGATGRTIIALLAGLAIAALGFVPQAKGMLVARVDAFARRPRIASADGEDAPVVRRADAHPDAPPRRPIRAASDLGDPLPIFGEEDRRSAPLPPRAEQCLPDDLDQPLADFDPAALPLRPMAPPEPVAPLARPTAPGVAPVDHAAPVSEPAPPRFAWLAPEEPDPVLAQPEPEPEPEPVAAAPSPAVDVTPTPAQVELPRNIEVAEPVTEREPSYLASYSTPVVPSPMPLVPAVESAPAPRSAPAAEIAEPVTMQPSPPAPESMPIVQLGTAAEPPVETPRDAATVGPATKPTFAPAAEQVEDDSIAGLLARLERGAAQRRIVTPTPVQSPAPAPTRVSEPEPEPVSLDETLQRLRRLAAG